jgi:conjugal transfer pilus assembly protein TraK
MMAFYAVGSAAAGTILMSRIYCILSRVAGACLITLAVFLFAQPAWADQTVVAADSAQVDCQASAKDLTRISLVDDEFASVSKISTGNPQDDFSVVNEPVRGDIYLSVPEGFGRPALSFFGTSKRGYVYKFVCRIAGDQAAQVFVSIRRSPGKGSRGLAPAGRRRAAGCRGRARPGHVRQQRRRRL